MRFRPPILFFFVLVALIGSLHPAAATAAPGTAAPGPTAEDPMPAEPDSAATELDDRVIYDTATVSARPLDTATGGVTILDRPTIEASGASTVADLLALVPGIDVVKSGTRGGLTTVRMRGGDPNFTRVLIDGVAVNDPVYQVGSVFDFEALPTAAVERVEIVRGALSSIHGSTGLAGTVHVITRGGPPGDDRALGGELEVGVGNADLAFGRASLGGRGERATWFVSANSEEESARVAEESFELQSAQARLDLELTERAHLRLAGRVADWQADDYADASGGPILGDGVLRLSDHRESSVGLVLDIEGEAPEGLERRHHVRASVYRHQLDRQSPAIFPLVPESIETTRFLRSRLGVSTLVGSSTAGTPDADAAARWRLGIGADVEEEDGRNDSILRLPPFLGGDVPGDYDLVRRTPGIYAEGFVERGNLLFELGVRIDWPEDGDNETSPRIGVVWSPGDGQTRLRASWGRAFQLPSFFALASPRALGGNPDLRPEIMTGGDIGVEHRFASGVRFELSYFDHLYEDLVDFDFQTFLHINRSKVDARGVEMQLDRGFDGGSGWLGGWSVAVTWQDVEDRATGAELRHRPEWSGGLRLHLRPAERWRLDLDLRGRSEVRDEQIPVPDRQTVDGHLLAGLRLLFEISGQIELEGRVDNLFDEDYEEYIGFPGAGTSGRLTLRYRFGGS